MGRADLPRVDATWARQKAIDRHPELGIADALEGRTLSNPTQPVARLVDPTVRPHALDLPGDSPAQRFDLEVGTIFDVVSPATDRRIDRFTALEDQTGYVLTHQWLQIIWAREIGRPLPKQVTDRAASLEAQVRAELGSPDETLDLWAERTALISMFGSGPATPQERDAWLCRAVRTQDAQGFWHPDGVYQQHYLDTSYQLTSEPEHVTALMVLLLGALVPPA